MSKTFEEASTKVLDVLAVAVTKYHADLDEAGVTFNVLMVHASRDEKTGMASGPAIKCHGYPAKAVVKINPLEKRVAGLADAMILVDGDEWGEWTEEHRLAVFDHELEHLELQKDEDDGVKLDDCGRPKLKLRLHDIVLEGFSEVAKRHGDASNEKMLAKFVADKFGQMLFPWG